MRCALIRPRPEGPAWEMEEPLGAEAICGYLRERGIACLVFDRRLGATVEQIEAFAPDVVGFSLMTQEDVPDAQRTLLKLRAPGRRFFVGGLFVTGEEGRCSALFPRDTALITGEGEGPVLSLVTGVPQPRPDPNGWAFASRDGLSEYLAHGGSIGLRSARGCRGACRFCTTPGAARGRHETRDLSLVVEEMAALAARGYPPIFNFTDDEFGDLERVHGLIEALKRVGLRAAFSMELRPSVVCRAERRDWVAFREGGLCRLFTGLESLDVQTLRSWNKPTDPDRLIAAVKACSDAGILCQTGYILFHAGSTVASVWQQVRALWRHGLFTPKAALSRMVLYPGSALYAQSGAKGAMLQPLSPEVENLHEDWSRAIKEYYDLWTKCAVRLPNAACRRFLTGDAGEAERLQDAIERISAASYAIIEGREFTDAEKEELYEICRRAVGAG